MSLRRRAPPGPRARRRSGAAHRRGAPPRAAPPRSPPGRSRRRRRGRRGLRSSRPARRARRARRSASARSSRSSSPLSSSSSSAQPAEGVDRLLREPAEAVGDGNRGRIHDARPRLSVQLNPFDDFPFHQALSPIDVPATSDSHFNDGYYFAFYRPGPPRLHGAAAAPELERDGRLRGRGRRQAEQRDVRFSRALRPRTNDLAVGPFRLDIVEPMNVQRVRLDDPELGLAFDVSLRGERARLLRDPPPAGAARARLQRRASLHAGLPGERRAHDRRRARGGRRLVRLPRSLVGNSLDDGAVRPARRPREGDARPARAAALGAVRMRRRRRVLPLPRGARRQRARLRGPPPPGRGAAAPDRRGAATRCATRTGRAGSPAAT